MPQHLKKVTPEYAKSFYGVNVIQGSIVASDGNQQVGVLGALGKLEDNFNNEDTRPLAQRVVQQKTDNGSLF